MTSLSDGGERAVEKRFAFVGPHVRHATGSGHTGGQLTAAVGIAAYAAAHHWRMDVVDTFIDSLARPSLPARLQAGFARLNGLRRLLRDQKVDAVMLFVGARLSFFERVLLAAVAKRRGVPSVFCIRDGAFTGWAQSSALLRRIIPRLLRIPDRIVVQGNGTRDVLAGSGVPFDRFSVIRNWLPATHSVARVPRRVEAGERLRLVYVGWLVKEKGLRELFDACSELARRYDFELELIGGGPLEAELRQRAAGHPFPDVRFLGWLPPSEVRHRLEQAHVFVLPSYFEGFPNALLEAMACGLPAVCSDVGAVAESIRDGVNGYVVPIMDARALGTAIEQYVKTPDLVSRHGDAALSVVRTLHDREENLAQLFACMSPT